MILMDTDAEQFSKSPVLPLDHPCLCPNGHIQSLGILLRDFSLRLLVIDCGQIQSDLFPNATALTRFAPGLRSEKRNCHPFLAESLASPFLLSAIVLACHCGVLVVCY